MAKVSVIVPCYNGEKYIDRCIESVLNQEFTDLELIVVNDGSKDNSKEIIDSYAAKDNRLIAIHKENSGVSATRNLALSKATGDYIQFIDCDDWLPLDSTKLLVREMEANNVEMVVADFYRVVEDEVTIRGSINEACVVTTKQYAERMLLSPADFYYGVLWNKLYKRSIIEKYELEMDPNIHYCEDMIFNLEYLLHAENIAVLKAPVYYYVKTPGSLVEQGTNIPGIIEMKKNVITYYSDFYKKILSPGDYLVRIPMIYSYFVAFSSEAVTIPFFTETKKLGREKGEEIHLNDNMLSTIVMDNYLSSSLIDFYLSTAGRQLKLEVKETKVLYLLYLANAPLTVDSLAGYSNSTNVQTVLSLAKLFALGYVKREKIQSRNCFVLVESDAKRVFDDIEADCENIRFKGMNSEEIEMYKKLEKQVIENTKNYLVK